MKSSDLFCRMENNPSVLIGYNSLVPRCDKTPNTNTVDIGSANAAAFRLIASNMLVNLPPWVLQSIAKIITIMEAILQALIKDLSFMSGFIR